MAQPRDSQPIPADGDSGGDGIIAVSADGRFVAFTSNATNLVPDDTNICKSRWANIPEATGTSLCMTAQLTTSRP